MGNEQSNQDIKLMFKQAGINVDHIIDNQEFKAKVDESLLALLIKDVPKRQGFCGIKLRDPEAQIILDKYFPCDLDNLNQHARDILKIFQTISFEKLWKDEYLRGSFLSNPLNFLFFSEDPDFKKRYCLIPITDVGETIHNKEMVREIIEFFKKKYNLE